MSPKEIRPVDRSCKSYRPGHQVHWIQAKKSVEDGHPVIYVSVVVHDDGQIDIEGHDLSLVIWNHDPARLRSALGYRARVVWKPRYHVLNVSGYIFSMADLAEQTACLQKVAPPPELDTTVDRVLWEARTYGSERGIDGIERMRLVRDDIAARVADLLDRMQTRSY